MSEKTLQEKPAKAAGSKSTAAKTTAKAETTKNPVVNHAAENKATPVPQRRIMQKTGNASAPYAPQPIQRQPNGAKMMDARELNKLSIAELTKLAVNYNIEDISGLRR